jgi:hypothetical protein
MKNACSTIARFVAASFVFGTLASASAATLSPEDSYIAARDAVIANVTKLYDDKKNDEAQKAEEAATKDLLARIKVILPEPDRKGFGPAQLNLEAFSAGDMGFELLDGLRFDSLFGANGERAHPPGPDGKWVDPGTHIVIATQSLFERWLRTKKDMMDKNKSVAQQIGTILRSENFYTHAISTDAAVVNFNTLPITKPAGATIAYAMLAARTQDAVPTAADEVFAAALANGKVYIAYGYIRPKVVVPACVAIKEGYDKKAQKAAEDLESKRITRKAYDKLGDIRQQGEDAYKKCFIERAPQQPSFAEATKQAQALLASAMGQ